MHHNTELHKQQQSTINSKILQVLLLGDSAVSNYCISPNLSNYNTRCGLGNKSTSNKYLKTTPP